MKNIQTDNPISLVELGGIAFGSYSAYYEQIEANVSWVVCTRDASGDYYAVLEEGLTTIEMVSGEACMNDALSSLESAIDARIEAGDDTPILKKWHCPQLLEA